MKKLLILLISSLILYSCVGTKDCTEWFAGMKLFAVEKDATNQEKIYDYYRTYFPKANLILLAQFYYSDDSDYDGCKSRTMINSIKKDSIFITCSSCALIGDDTIPANDNLFRYFKLIDNEEMNGHYVFEYDKSEYHVPEFFDKTNTFKVKIKSSDRMLEDSCVIRFE